ncbi:MAG: DUF4290 domain-containing protein [Bacteroidetes bacterium]|nr:MAG: DUF4290 domain-containing protein [Bacteroidota bacterium]
MEYNTTRGPMAIAEYGRNMQRMIEYITTIEDREKRTRAAKFIVNIMAQMHPQAKETADYKHKLWDHLYIISDFKLDVDSPYPPPPPLTLSTKPELISYHDADIEFRHYGKNISLMIEKAAKYEDGPEKDALAKAIANHMKKSYLNWNRDSVSDELIEEQLTILSKGELKLHKDTKLAATSEILARNKKRRPFRPKENNSQNFRGRKKPQ